MYPSIVTFSPSFKYHLSSFKINFKVHLNYTPIVKLIIQIKKKTKTNDKSVLSVNTVFSVNIEYRKKIVTTWTLMFRYVIKDKTKS